MSLGIPSANSSGWPLRRESSTRSRDGSFERRGSWRACGCSMLAVARALTAARARAAARGLRNVSFREGDPTRMKFERAFDAVIGRYVLQYQRDPAAMLR